MSQTASNSNIPANPNKGRGKPRRGWPRTNDVNMPSGKKVSIVIPIHKIQNCCLWSKFRAKEKQIAKDCRFVNERMLFHGSPAADIIAQTGFDINQAKVGCFGRGCYFAPNSSRSNNHASGFLGHRKMLFCRVALGRMHSITAVDNTLVQPPPRHHSVEGKLAETEIIVYDDAQAYPEYLVNYDIQN